MPNCKALTKAGAPCRAKAGPNGTCYLHDSPERARLLGQIGGQKNRQQLPEPPTGPFTLTDLRNTLATTIRGVQSKTITPRAAGAIAQLSNSMKSMLVADELERRVAALEQQLAEQHRAAAYASEAETAANLRRGCRATDGGASFQLSRCRSARRGPPKMESRTAARGPQLQATEAANSAARDA